MAKSYNIIERLRARNERPFVAISENATYTINNSKTTALHFMAIEKDENLDYMQKMDKMIEVSLGKKAFKEIEEMELSMPAYELLFEAITAAMAGEELAQAEERFQETTVES